MLSSGERGRNGRDSNAECGMRNAECQCQGRTADRASTPPRPSSIRHSPLRTVFVLSLAASPLAGQAARPRALDLGIVVGVLAPGPLDAITDVAGVRVGHARSEEHTSELQ